MLRFLLFFGGVFVLTGILGQIPLLGAFFRIPFFGFYLSAILLSALLAWAGTVAVDAGRRRSLERTLGAVDTSHHKGKLAGLFLSQGKHARARPLFAAAMELEPDRLEWQYGFARAAAWGGEAERASALKVLEGLLTVDEEHGYGDAMLLAARLHRRAGDTDAALDCVRRFERNHGPSPESALLRGRLHGSQSQSDEAARAFDEALELARTKQGRADRWIRARVLVARWFK